MKGFGNVFFEFFEVELVSTVAACQKRDIVDTFSHASRAPWHNMYKQTTFPNTWGKAEKDKSKDDWWLFMPFGVIGVELLAGDA